MISYKSDVLWLVSTEQYGLVQYSKVRNYFRFHCQKLWMVK